MYILSLSLVSLSQASYNFLAKFEELNRRILPLSDLAQQMYPSQMVKFYYLKFNVGFMFLDRNLYTETILIEY